MPTGKKEAEMKVYLTHQDTIHGVGFDAWSDEEYVTSIDPERASKTEIRRFMKRAKPRLVVPLPIGGYTPLPPIPPAFHLMVETMANPVEGGPWIEAGECGDFLLLGPDDEDELTLDEAGYSTHP